MASYLPSVILALGARSHPKRWRRDRKTALTGEQNPDWADLYPAITGELIEAEAS